MQSLLEPLGLLNHLFDLAYHIKGLLRKVIVFPFDDLLESNRIVSELRSWPQTRSRRELGKSAFSDDGYTGMGVGGQFRLKLGSRLNSDWFADYISF